MRAPDQVMAPDWFGAVRLTRYSFNRMLIRRAFAEKWQISQVRLDVDAEGRGSAVYRVQIADLVFHFVAFTTTLDESQHTDRVVADKWEITATLIEGELDDDLFEHLRLNVPLQEQGRFDSRVLVLTRGNRSVRFFQYLVDTLAAGSQPSPEKVADAGYIMRSTAFYGNGKFGMRSFEGYEQDHPLGVSYRPQFLCAWLFRELSYVVVEHCAQLAGGERAVGFDSSWDRFFGLGNATGLGLVPYAFKHPAVLDSWVSIRESALADVRAMAGSDFRSSRLRGWIDRVDRHFATGGDDDCTPFLSSAEMAPFVPEIAAAFNEREHQALPYDALYMWAESRSRELDQPELAELVVSLLIELHDGDDDAVDKRLFVDEWFAPDPATTIGQLRSELDRNFSWLDELDLDGPESDWFWWLVSDNTDEPRRAPMTHLEPESRNVPVDVALRVHRLAKALPAWSDESTVAELLAAEPAHQLAVKRVLDYHTYGEPRDNACAKGYLPLVVQRFQLAMYGMDNFKPKSTDWLRVTLYQGAPRIGDLAASNSNPKLDEQSLAAIDAWPWPPRPDKEAVK